MSRFTIGLVVAAFVVCAATAHAQVECPLTISVEQKTAAPDAWSIDYSKMPAELSSATIFDGPPEEQASLKYDDERASKDEIIQTWQLPASARGHWLVCGYTNTTAQLRRKLPDDVRACEVVLEKGVAFGNGGAVVKRARCISGAHSHDRGKYAVQIVANSFHSTVVRCRRRLTPAMLTLHSRTDFSNKESAL